MEVTESILLVNVLVNFNYFRTPSSRREGEGVSEDFYQNQLAAEIWEQATIERNTERRTRPETIPIPPSPDNPRPVPSQSGDRGTPGPDQYLTTSLERNLQSREYVNIDLQAERQKRLNANSHARVTNPGCERRRHATESSTPLNGFLEELQRKWQQIRKSVVSTIRIKINGRPEQGYENESTIESISRRHHDNWNTAGAETNAKAGQSEAERINRWWSFWPFRKATKSSDDYENEETIERIRQNNLQQNETDTRSADGETRLSGELPPLTHSVGVHSPTRPQYLELI